MANRFWPDYRGIPIRVTDERMSHIMEHPEMRGMEGAIAETLLEPDQVVRSVSDERTVLIYRYYPHTMVGGKFLCVVVKESVDDRFLLTAYLTDRIKQGEIIWKKG